MLDHNNRTSSSNTENWHGMLVLVDVFQVRQASGDTIFLIISMFVHALPRPCLFNVASSRQRRLFVAHGRYGVQYFVTRVHI